MYEDRIKNSALMSKIISASDAASLIKENMKLGFSGFTSAGYAGNSQEFNRYIRCIHRCRA